MLIFITFENLTKSVEVEDENMGELMGKLEELFEFKAKIPLSLYDEEDNLIDDTKGLSDLQKVKLKFKDVKDLSEDEIEELTTDMVISREWEKECEPYFFSYVKDKDFSKDVEFYIFRALITRLSLLDEVKINITALIYEICAKQPECDADYHYLILDYLFDNLPNINMEGSLDYDLIYGHEAFYVDHIQCVDPTAYAVAKLFKNDKLAKYLCEKGYNTNPDIFCFLQVRGHDSEMKISLNGLLEPKCEAYLNIMSY